MKYLVAVSAVFLAVAGAASQAQVRQSKDNGQDLQKSGSVFDIAACPKPRDQEQAQCFLRLVSDENGRLIHGEERSTADAMINTRANAVRTAAGWPGLPKTPRDIVCSWDPFFGSSHAPVGYCPAELQSAYNVPKLSGAPGSGPTIAVVSAYDSPGAEVLLFVYRRAYGLGDCTEANGCFHKVDQNPAHPSGTAQALPTFNLGWAQETALDLAMVSAACPQCKIVLVEADNSNTSSLSLAVDKAAALGAKAISNSYGTAEGAWTASWETHYNKPGIAITVSSGDSGFVTPPNFPASSPHVTAVGGTKLWQSATPRGWSESAWGPGLHGGGSGCSAVYSRPVWQSLVLIPTTICAKRASVDIAAIADPDPGVAIAYPLSVNTYAWGNVGGTSAGAPFIAGLYGVHRKLTPGDTVLHARSIYLYKSSLFDVTTGSNGICAGTAICTAKVGYDGPTGLGTPNGVAALGECVSSGGGGSSTC